jgi:hypothetical protein
MRTRSIRDELGKSMDKAVTGNDAQIHIIAQQLFDIWKVNLEQRTPVPVIPVMAKKFSVGDWISLLSLIVSLGTIVFVAGFMYGQVQQNHSDIQELKRSRDDSIDRLARIETKLDQILNTTTTRRKSISSSS